MNKNTNELLQIQADLTVWYQKIKNFHWHIKDIMFFEIHEELDKLAEKVLEFVDEFAEKVIMQNEKAYARLSDILKASRIEEIEANDFSQMKICKTVVKDAKFLLEQTTNIDWGPTEQPLLDELFMFLDKTIWMYSKNIG
ncbi:starvation-inducible DNA-binding protein [Mycoplasma testudineum]|uniref:Starvation-inducible DNA-binding protein n=1 Tax=Mycoplasma testudineum TaxID=244584 RepID=A0A4R6IF36_9MOLU|nr:DNA starvation/stationary phase protection protein [Mycoplasma testudineum]OYD26851.1 DNA starvation/stationary phase protection protein [Mycoplasma testudineum]TDO20386.1 starvation-inducible DNA-binding protein [Mycoplasma testudineum]